MCRGGKDGKVVRCKVKDSQIAKANLRKKIKYRADKESMSVEEWKQGHPAELAAVIQRSFPTASQIDFQPVDARRTLADGVPERIEDHIRLSMDHIESRLSADEMKALAGYTGFAAGVANSVLLNGKITENTLYDKAPPWKEAPTAPCDFSTREDLVDYLETMDNVLSERSDTQRVLYRGMPIYAKLHEEIEMALGKQIGVEDTEAMKEGLKAYYTPGKIMEFPSYVSTTLSAFYAADRTQEHSGTKITYYDSPKIKGIVFEMKTNAGLDVTGAARNHAYEREVLLPRESRYRVESVSITPETYDTISGYDHVGDDDQDEQNFTNLAVVVQMVEIDEDGNEITHSDAHNPSPLKLG